MSRNGKVRSEVAVAVAATAHNQDNEGLVARFAALTPLVREHRDAAERDARLSTPVVAALVDAGITRLFLSRDLGGYEVDPLTCAQITRTLAQADTAAAWFVMVANASRLMAATWSADMARRHFADPDCVIAASGNRPLTGERIDGGYRLSGVNGFVSGCHHAQKFMTPNQIGAERFMAVLPMSECEILDNWDAWGMRGTGSNDVAVNGVCIGADDAQPLLDVQEPNALHRGALFRCPGRVLFATYVPITLVLAEQALAYLAELAQAKVPAGTAHKLRDRELAQVKYGKALAIFRSAELYFLQSLQQAYERAVGGARATPQEKADLYLAGTHAVQASAEVVRLVADAAGSSVIFERDPLARIVRDMEMLRHHGFANESRYASVSQQLWGAELDYPLLLR